MAEWQEPAAGAAPGAAPEAPKGGDNWAGDLAAMIAVRRGGHRQQDPASTGRSSSTSRCSSMATGQTMSSHAASRPATIHVLGGEGKITIGDNVYDAKRAPSSTCRPASRTRWSRPTTWCSCCTSSANGLIFGAACLGRERRWSAARRPRGATSWWSYWPTRS